MSNTKVTAKQAIKAVKGTGGVKVAIAKKLNVARQTVDVYLRRWPTFLEAYNEEKCVIDDAALSVVIGDIMTNKDVSTAKWWLAKKNPEEFGDKREVTIRDWRDKIPEDRRDDFEDFFKMATKSIAKKNES
ncbi:MAG: hypothetical protein GY938_16860 [Ketobacter sp.]|nr:hypothetical protein [Ketobacter sp.]